MLKSKLLSLAVCFVGSSMLVVLLGFYSDWKSNHLNGFIRTFPPHKITGIRFVDLKYNSWYIAGKAFGKLYMGNYIYPNGILKVNYLRQDTAFERISGFDTVTFFKGTTCQLDSSNFYLFDGIKSVVVSGKTTDLKLKNIQRTPPFTAALPLSPKSFILRVVTKGRDNTLIKQINENVITWFG